MVSHIQFSSINHPRSTFERGLHERAAKKGVALPCPISFRSIPVRKSADDPTVEMVDWPFLLPHNFDPW